MAGYRPHSLCPPSAEKKKEDTEWIQCADHPPQPYLQHAESQKKNSRFSFAEDSAIEKHFKKEALEDMRDELRKAFQYFGKAGQWERLQAEIAQERARIKKELAEQQRIKDRNLMITTVTALVVLGTVAIVAWIKFLQGGF